MPLDLVKCCSEAFKSSVLDEWLREVAGMHLYGPIEQIHSGNDKSVQPD